MVMACSGQRAAHIPQPLQRSSSTRAISFSSFLMAPKGQTTTHTLQPTQRFSSTTALSASHKSRLARHSAHGPQAKQRKASNMAFFLVFSKLNRNCRPFSSTHSFNYAGWSSGYVTAGENPWYAGFHGNGVHFYSRSSCFFV